MSVQVIQVLLGQVNCVFLTASLQCRHTHSQIKSFLWGGVWDLGEVQGMGEHTYRGRKQRPSFSKTVTHPDWERVSQELWMSYSGSNTSSHGLIITHVLVRDWFFPSVVRGWPQGSLDTFLNSLIVIWMHPAPNFQHVWVHWSYYFNSHGRLTMGWGEVGERFFCSVIGYIWSQINALPQTAFSTLKQFAGILHTYQVKQNCTFFSPSRSFAFAPSFSGAQFFP